MKNEIKKHHKQYENQQLEINKLNDLLNKTKETTENLKKFQEISKNSKEMNFDYRASNNHKATH